MRRLVADTGPLLHLAEADGLHLLQLAGELHVPPLVVKELRYTAPALPFPAWIIQDTLEPLHVTESVAWQQADLLDAGEAEAIALARQIQLERLSMSSLWISSKVMAEAQAALRAMFL